MSISMAGPQSDQVRELLHFEQEAQASQAALLLAEGARSLEAQRQGIEIRQRKLDDLQGRVEALRVAMGTLQSPRENQGLRAITDRVAALERKAAELEAKHNTHGHIHLVPQDLWKTYPTEPDRSGHGFTSMNYSAMLATPVLIRFGANLRNAERVERARMDTCEQGRWIEGVRQEMPEILGRTDYSFVFPEQRTRREPSLEEFRRILDVSSDASQQEIGRSYRRLSLRFHPDTLTGSAERYMEVRQAYERLLPSENVHNEFRFNPEESAEDNFIQAKAYFDRLKPSAFTFSLVEIQNLIEKLNPFLEQLKIAQGQPSGDPLIELHRERLLQKSQALLYYWQITQLVLSIHLPDGSLSAEAKTQWILDQIEQLNRMSNSCDLTNSKDTWSEEVKDQLVFAQLMVLDKSLSLYRSLVELAASDQKTDQMIRFCELASIRYITNRREVRQAFSNLNRNEDLFRKKWTRILPTAAEPRAEDGTRDPNMAAEDTHESPPITGFADPDPLNPAFLERKLKEHIGQLRQFFSTR